MMAKNNTRELILRDLAQGGPMALTVMRDAYGGYAYPCVYKAQAEGLVESRARTKCYSITEAGRRLIA